jgi:hypothetical protein
MKSMIIALVFAGSALAMDDAAAMAVYKLIGKDGKVTYTQLPPSNFDGSISRLDIDADANAVTLPAPVSRAELTRKEVVAGKVVRPLSVPDGDRLEAAQKRVDAAQRALEDAQNNAGPEDYIWFGPNNPLGMRRALKPEYLARISQLEQDLNLAQEDLKTAERRR